MKIGFDVRDGARELLFRSDVGFSLFALLQNALCFFLVLPKGRVADFFFEGFQAFAAGGNVKDNSGRVRCVFSVLRSALPSLPCAGLLAWIDSTQENGNSKMKGKMAAQECRSKSAPITPPRVAR
jgi:hypothetical protein